MSKTKDNPDVLLPVNKQNVVHIYSRMLLSNKKKQIIYSGNSMDESQINFANCKKPETKGCVISCIWLSGKGKKKKISSCQGLRVEYEVNYRMTEKETFWGDKIFWIMIVVVNIQFSQITKYTPQRINSPDVKLKRTRNKENTK